VAVDTLPLAIEDRPSQLAIEDCSVSLSSDMSIFDKALQASEGDIEDVVRTPDSYGLEDVFISRIGNKLH